MAAILLAAPIRVADLAGLRLGRHLQRRGEGWWLELGAEETKTGQPVALPFPETLVPAL